MQHKLCRLGALLAHTLIHYTASLPGCLGTSSVTTAGRKQVRGPAGGAATLHPLLLIRSPSTPHKQHCHMFAQCYFSCACCLQAFKSLVIYAGNQQTGSKAVHVTAGVMKLSLLHRFVQNASTEHARCWRTAAVMGPATAAGALRASQPGCLRQLAMP